MLFRKFIVDNIVTESSTIKSFYLRRSDGEPVENYLPGQFITLRVKPDDTDGELVRNYTLSDSPGKTYFRLTIKREERGQVSRYFHDVLAAGDCIEVSKPIGNFHLSGNSAKPVVLLSGGVGITPMLSILEYILAHEPARRVFFLHASRNKAVQPMLPRLRELVSRQGNVYLSIHHSQPAPDEQPGIDYDYAGLITKEHLQSVLPAIPIDYFLCGSGKFIETLYQYLQELGISEESIRYEFFGEAKALGSKRVQVDLNTNHFKVTFTKSGKDVSWDSSQPSLLDLAESVGLAPEFSCRMGTCSTCESTLLTGTVLYDPEPFMEIPVGKLLLCCSTPVSDVEIDL